MRNPGARAVLVAVACILCCPCLVSAQDGGYLFITKWGGTGTADGKFNGPRGIAASHSDSFVYLYVTDYFNCQRLGVRLRR